MKINQILLQEITNSELWLSREKEESIYKRDLKKRIELINWVLENMKNPNAHICSLIESRMNETIQGINKTDSIFQAEKLLDFIQDNPGCHLRHVKRKMSISMGTVQYHLDKLEKMGRITSSRRGLYKYYFPAGLFKENEKDILEVLTHETARKILMFIIEQKNPTQTDIVNSVKISPRSISWHVGRMVALNIITEIKDGKYKRYQIYENEAKFILTLLRSYYPNIWDKWSMRIVEMFLSLSINREKE